MTTPSARRSSAANFAPTSPRSATPGLYIGSSARSAPTNAAVDAPSFPANRRHIRSAASEEDADRMVPPIPTMCGRPLPGAYIGISSPTMIIDKAPCDVYDVSQKALFGKGSVSPELVTVATRQWPPGAPVGARGVLMTARLARP